MAVIAEAVAQHAFETAELLNELRCAFHQRDSDGVRERLRLRFLGDISVGERKRRVAHRERPGSRLRSDMDEFDERRLARPARAHDHVDLRTVKDGAFDDTGRRAFDQVVKLGRYLCECETQPFGSVLARNLDPALPHPEQGAVRLNAVNQVDRFGRTRAQPRTLAGPQVIDTITHALTVPDGEGQRMVAMGSVSLATAVSCHEARRVGPQASTRTAACR